ncbi:MAG: GDP-mannose 4,6-dehydratase, partial [Acidimicrobiales bacterium]
RVSVARPLFDAKVNLLGTLNLLEAARAAGCSRVVFAASGGTLYGEPAPEDLPVTESHPPRPLSPYGVSKKAAIDYMIAYRELHGLEFCALALANVYGPRQDPHGEAGVVAIFARQLLSGQVPTIFGSGSQTRDFVYVDDVVDAFSKAATRGGGLVLNIGTGTETSVEQLYDVLAGAAVGAGVAKAGPGGAPPEPMRAPARPGELDRSALDPSRAKVYLGWEPWTSLEEGAAAVLRWMRDAGPG